MFKKVVFPLLATAVSVGSFAAENDDVMVVTASGYEQKLREAAAK